MKEIDLYCKICRKSMRMSYELTGNGSAPVLPGMTIKCHTNKCNRVLRFKGYTEAMLIKRADNNGLCHL